MLGLSGSPEARTGLRPYFAVPFGDMMLCGCFGLLGATAALLPEAGKALHAAITRSPGRHCSLGRSLGNNLTPPPVFSTSIVARRRSVCDWRWILAVALFLLGLGGSLFVVLGGMFSTVACTEVPPEWVYYLLIVVGILLLSATTAASVLIIRKVRAVLIAAPAALGVL